MGADEQTPTKRGTAKNKNALTTPPQKRARANGNEYAAEAESPVKGRRRKIRQTQGQ
jgi:hypothetical protein